MRGALRHGAVTAVSVVVGGEHTQAFGVEVGAVRGRRSRVVPTPGVLASNLAVMWRPTGTRIERRRGDGGNSATLPEESTKDTVKTIRAGKAGRPASPVIHPRVHLSLRTDRGCRRRPAFPAPSGLSRAANTSKTRAKGAARMRVCVCQDRRSIEAVVNTEVMPKCNHLPDLVPRTQCSAPRYAKHRRERCAAEPGPMQRHGTWLLGPGSAQQRKERCSASGTRAAYLAARRHKTKARSRSRPGLCRES